MSQCQVPSANYVHVCEPDCNHSNLSQPDILITEVLPATAAPLTEDLNLYIDPVRQYLRDESLGVFKEIRLIAYDKNNEVKQRLQALTYLGDKYTKLEGLEIQKIEHSGKIKVTELEVDV